MLDLCTIEQERKSIGFEKLSPHKEIEDEAGHILESMSILDLRAFES
jgi:hypothetical protein